MKAKKADLYYKMMINVKNHTFLDLFQHISQVKQFNVMLSRVNKKEMIWTSHDAEHKAVGELVRTSEGKQLSKITVKRNVSHFVEVGLLLKITRGVYKVNPEYIAFGKDE